MKKYFFLFIFVVSFSHAQFDYDYIEAYIRLRSNSENSKCIITRASKINEFVVIANDPSETKVTQAVIRYPYNNKKSLRYASEDTRLIVDKLKQYRFCILSASVDGIFNKGKSRHIMPITINN